MANYKKLAVWQKSMDLVMSIYDMTENFPDFEKYGLTSQMQRSGVSIPSNIAEGYGRESDKDCMHFLHIARGSLFELQTQLYIAVGRGYISSEQMEETDRQINEIGRMLAGLIKKIKLLTEV